MTTLALLQLIALWCPSPQQFATLHSDNVLKCRTALIKCVELDDNGGFYHDKVSKCFKAFRSEETGK